ncbi:hypothetical protein [Schumannella soli]|uniref:Uncharacterized protein n=1 Tax=Schumannella soli TaxID=2590779 RepID=A0A506Y5Z4_9MICO|nr:hypothetical protein [Schumannella soli]TPW78086.1 hypothetical protein FJ657_05520 [Schumannella soli]
MNEPNILRSARGEQIADVAQRLHAEFPRVPLAEVFEIVIEEHRAILDHDPAAPITGLVAAGALERVARRQSIAELEQLMLTDRTSALHWASPDRDIWVAEDNAGWVGMIERHGAHFHVVGHLGQDLGDFADLTAAAAALTHTELVQIYSAITPA